VVVLIFYSKTLVQNCKQKIKTEVEELKNLGANPSLCVIQIGNDFSSNTYVRNKQLACDEVEITCTLHHFTEGAINQEGLIKLVQSLNENEDVHAILVQLPLPSSFALPKLLSVIDPAKDVDGFCAFNIGKLFLDEPTIIPCTPLAVLTILKDQNIKISGKHCVIVGRSNVVGKPMIALMLKESATVTVCHSKTKNLTECCRTADILICATGVPKLITREMVKPECVIIDVGISRGEDGKCSGDVDFEALKDDAKLITPVPGGVGPMTVAMLLQNVLTLTKRRFGLL
jgi:methylenetetrahydrofolate dehydrogenase (NADP+)/methenyltetrahydrofolate cyclohydrolase